MKKVLVWDLPLRVFHAVLVVLVVVAIVTAKLGGNALDWHIRVGVALLGLLFFRLVWGFLGGSHARFSNFVRGPKTVVDYLRGRSDSFLGHNPLGALSVLAILAVLLLQVVTGLFSNDDVMVEGPLYVWVSKTLSDSLTAIHLQAQYPIFALIGLHITAVLYYRFVRKQDIIKPMVTGRKLVAPEVAAGQESRGGSPALGFGILGFSLLAAWILVVVAR